MKKFINDPQDVVAEALRGIEAAHPDLRVDHQHKIIYRGDAPRRDKVGIISGGGSGHEPLHGGFVGLGMLDAACAGEVFTSPVPDQMLAATKLVDGGAGVLHVVKNYTGDVMNFDMAAEMAAADWCPGPLRGHRRRRRRPGQHLDRWPARRRGHRATGKDRRRRSRTGPDPGAGGRHRPPGQREWSEHGPGALPRAPFRQPASPPSTSVKTRWSWESASTASPAVNACHWPPHVRSLRCSSSPC